jgi:hypothetical protein
MPEYSVWRLLLKTQEKNILSKSAHPIRISNTRRSSTQLFLCAVLFLTAISTGCASARMYPVQGPMASETPGAVYSAKLTGLLYSGDITIKSSTGEVCKGHWTLVKGGTSEDGVSTPAANASATSASAANAALAPASAPPNSGPSSVAEGMPAAWDAVYGQGYYVAHVLGQRLYAHALVTGNQGTILNVEFYRVYQSQNEPGQIHGVAKDNKGDIFKLAF